MAISKKDFKLVLFVCMLIGCTPSEPCQEQKSKIEDLEEENTQLLKQADTKQELLDSWFSDFDFIQTAINGINTEEVLSLQMQNLERGEDIRSDKAKALDKVREIRELIDQKENQLAQLGVKAQWADKIILNLKESLKGKEKVINLLKRENKKVKADNQVLEGQNQKQTNTIEEQQSQINKQTAELRKKEQELKDKEIEIYSRLAAELLAVSQKLPQVKRKKQTRREIASLKKSLEKESERYKQKAAQRSHSN